MKGPCSSAIDQQLFSRTLDKVCAYGESQLTGHQRVTKVILTVLVVLDVFPLESISSAAVEVSRFPLTSMRQYENTGYPLFEHQLRDPSCGGCLNTLERQQGDEVVTCRSNLISCQALHTGLAASQHSTLHRHQCPHFLIRECNAYDRSYM